jgi:dTDP-4-dehydrorhamnose reductase
MSSESPLRVLITGASGLLGRAAALAFSRAGWAVTGCGFSRCSQGGLLRLDLTDSAAVASAVAALRPHVIVHSAAERRPDVCEKDPAASERLNIEAVWVLGRAAEAAGAKLLFISTDYLFDGSAAPYAETAPLSPLNAYGSQKARGEHAALAACSAPFILRVPVLYGPTADLTESAVTTFAAAVAAHQKPQSIDDWQIRVPTLTSDIGATLVNVAAALTSSGAPSQLSGIFHYSSSERWTRYQLVQLFGELMGLPTEHISRMEGAPPGARRPYDCQLDCSKLQATGLAAPHTPFREALQGILGSLQLLAGQNLKKPEGVPLC